MTDKEVLELAKQRKKEKPPDKFRAWLYGYRKPGQESDKMRREFDKLLEK